MSPVSKLEVHEHVYTSGPNAGGFTKVAHSHADGNVGHKHPDTGPASFTIDKDEWLAATGLKGGGRKKFTRTPSGVQLEYVELSPEQKTFTVIFCDDGYTPEIARSTGLSQADWEQNRDRFKAAAESDGTPVPPPTNGPPGGAAVANMALRFGMTPVYEYRGPRRPRRGRAS